MSVERLAAYSVDELRPLPARDDCNPYGMPRPRRQMLCWGTETQARAEALSLSAATTRRDWFGRWWSVPLERLDEWADTHGAAPAYA